MGLHWRKIRVIMKLIAFIVIKDIWYSHSILKNMHNSEDSLSKYFPIFNHFLSKGWMLKYISLFSFQLSKVWVQSCFITFSHSSKFPKYFKIQIELLNLTRRRSKSFADSIIKIIYISNILFLLIINLKQLLESFKIVLIFYFTIVVLLSKTTMKC